MTADPQTSPDARWFRKTPDSSTLDRPRLLARSLLPLPQLDDQIAYYEALLGVSADLRMPIPDFGGLELAAVGNVLLIASERAFTPIQRRTSYSLIVPELQHQLKRLTALDVAIVEPEERIMPGSRARVRYPDGSLAELVEHRPRPGETAVRPAERASTNVRLFARHEVRPAHLPNRLTFLQAALETDVSARWRAGGEAELVVIGNMVVVGASTATTTAEAAGPESVDPHGQARIDFVLLTDSITELRRQAGAVLVENGAWPGAQRQVWRLPTGAIAEVWHATPSQLRASESMPMSESVR